LNKLYEEYKRRLHVLNGWSLLKDITRYHRIQGSSDLWRAIERVKEMVSDKGFDVKVINVESDREYGYFTIPVSWDPVEAWLEIKTGDQIIASYDLIDHPTLLAAHSPSGGGCAELTVCRDKDCNGEAVLTDKYVYDMYLNTDAKFILYYDESRYPDAFPYTGLFITSSEIRNKVVMTIPSRLASRLINQILVKGKKITVCWRAETKFNKRSIPVLIACKGSEPGVLYISHICHPKPSAHDNASGSVANYLILETLSKMPSEYTYSTCHVWVPEYTGTFFIYDKLPWKPIGVINLDMVGSKQHVTGSTTVVVNPPRFTINRSAAALWMGLTTAFNISKSFNNIPQPALKYGLTPYSVGSDHDVAVIWGWDATMLNDWPSKFYHTDMDDIETLDKYTIGDVAVASLIAGYILVKSGKIERYVKTYEAIVKNWYRVEALKKNYSLSFLSKYLLKKPLITQPLDKPLLETPLTSRMIYRIIGRDRFYEYQSILRNLSTYLSVYALMSEKIGLKNHLEHYMAEMLISLKDSERDIVVKLWDEIKSTLSI